MSDPRPWILLLAVVTFLSGVAAGVLFTRVTSADRERGPFDDYARMLVDEFDLSDERAGHLSVILREYEEAIQRAVREHEASFYATLSEQLRPTGVEYSRFIRDKVLPPDQRTRFDALAAGRLLVSEDVRR